MFLPGRSATQLPLECLNAHSEVIQQTCLNLGIDFMTTSGPIARWSWCFFDFVRLRTRGTGRMAATRRGPGRRYA